MTEYPPYLTVTFTRGHDNARQVMQAPLTDEVDHEGQRVYRVLVSPELFPLVQARVITVEIEYLPPRTTLVLERFTQVADADVTRLVGPRHVEVQVDGLPVGTDPVRCIRCDTSLPRGSEVWMCTCCLEAAGVPGD